MGEVDKKISLIVVNYKSAKKLELCLASVFRLTKEIDPEVIVVNNDAEGALDKTKRMFPWLKVIENKSNGGFGRGVNLGAEAARGEILFILNPDTELVFGNIQAVLDEFEQNEKIGIVGSGIVDFSEKIQPWIAGTEKNLWDLIKNNLGFCDSKIIWASPVKIEADWVAATAMFIRKELFFKLAGFDENFFMYFEDADLCQRAKSVGVGVIFFPDFKVKHCGGASFGSRKEQKKHYYNAQEYYFKKHRPKWEYGFIKILRKFFQRYAI